MEINTVICDIDGTLLPPDQGVIINRRVEEALCQLQQQGMTLILASARIFQGVLPVALQAHMDTFGGYILSSNGAYAYDVMRKKRMFVHAIEREDALTLQHLFQRAGLDFAIAQPEYMVASGFSRGFQLDHFNCDIDYHITQHPDQLITKEISKCSASGTPEQIDACFAQIKQTIEKNYPYVVVRSTPYFVDILCKGCDKAAGLEELFSMLSLSFSQAAAIGDGDSDAEMIRRSAFGATLENGSQSCQKAADMITASCEELGCLTFFEKLTSDVSK